MLYQLVFVCVSGLKCISMLCDMESAAFSDHKQLRRQHLATQTVHDMQQDDAVISQHFP